MKISMIAAMSSGNVLGKDGNMPWGHLPADLKHFKKTTLGKPVVMGRVTYEGVCTAMKKPVGSPLPGRTVILISRSTNLEYVNGISIIQAGSIHEVCDKADALGASEVMVAGGESIYEMFLLRADRLHITFIDGFFSGDRFFPAYDAKQWIKISEKKHYPDEKNPYGLLFATFDRKK